MYLPPQDDLNREWYRSLLRGEKQAMPISDVHFINVPKNPELSVKKLIPQIKNNVSIMQYMPNNYDKKRTISRPFFYNIINTVYPDFLPQLIKHSQEQRQLPTEEDDGRENIYCNDEWAEKLKNTSFISSKYDYDGVLTLCL